MKDKDFEKIKTSLAVEIKAARLAIGLSQEDLALAAGVDRTYVSKLERGIANPSLLIIFKISKCLNSELIFSLNR